ncbi:hypothetical protein K3495_g4524 [Podosphaera aphanis]|nr:hypothetical protein K3495_g4524 [Podosphaera aphanis]
MDRPQTPPPSTNRRPRLTRDQRLQIKSLHNSGKSQKDIANELHFSLRQVGNAVHSSHLTPQKAKGRPPVLSNEQVDLLEAYICACNANREAPFLGLATGPFQCWGVSENVIGSVLKKRGYGRHRACEKPILTDDTKRIRREWANAHREWTVEDWERVLWTYGNWGVGSQWSNVFVTVKSEERLNFPLPATKVRKRARWMFWGSFAGSQKGPCLFWQKNWGPVNPEKYCEKIIPLIDDMISKTPWLLVMQDSTQFYSVTDNNGKLHQRFISTVDWPIDSPDLSPIEPIWNLMKNFIHLNYPGLEDRKYQSIGEIEMIVMKAWDSITSEDLMDMVKSMPRKCQAVLDVDGEYIKF